MADVLIVHQFEILITNVFGMHISFIILQVLTIVEVPLPESHIGPHFKCVIAPVNGSMLCNLSPSKVARHRK